MKRDYRSNIVLVLLVGVGVFNFIDYFLTTRLIANGHQELNPIMNGLIGTIYFPIYKLLVIPACLGLLWYLRKTVIKRWMFGVWVAFAVYLSLMLYFGAIFM